MEKAAIPATNTSTSIHRISTVSMGSGVHHPERVWMDRTEEVAGDRSPATLLPPNKRQLLPDTGWVALVAAVITPPPIITIAAESLHPKDINGERGVDKGFPRRRYTDLRATWLGLVTAIAPPPLTLTPYSILKSVWHFIWWNIKVYWFSSKQQNYDGSLNWHLFVKEIP